MAESNKLEDLLQKPDKFQLGRAINWSQDASQNLAIVWYIFKFLQLLTLKFPHSLMPSKVLFFCAYICIYFYFYSIVSSIGMLGNVAEMYQFGVHHFLANVFMVASAFISIKFFIPVLYNLKITSMYEVNC